MEGEKDLKWPWIKKESKRQQTLIKSDSIQRMRVVKWLSQGVGSFRSSLYRVNITLCLTSASWADTVESAEHRWKSLNTNISHQQHRLCRSVLTSNNLTSCYIWCQTSSTHLSFHLGFLSYSALVTGDMPLRMNRRGKHTKRLLRNILFLTFSD